MMVKTQYPVVLVHGMMAKDFRLWRAFRGISDFLRKEGLTVYVTNQDGVGGIVTNALQLREEILEILNKENCEKVNIIAHSKGGLDSRYAIAKLDIGDKVASLTTINTPHRGCLFADYLLNKIPTEAKDAVANTYNAALRKLGAGCRVDCGYKRIDEVETFFF